jgi:Cof subfamily protein (haloacid dehalogenase superfamily)
MPYRLLALDLDGTAIELGRMPTPRVKQAVADAAALGVRVVVATGRPYASARRFQAALDLETPLISFQGALVKEVGGARDTLLARPLPEEPLAEVIALVEQHDWEFNLYSEEFIYLARLHHPESFYERWFGLSCAVVPSMPEALRVMRERGTPPLKAMFIGDSEFIDRLTPELLERFGDRFDVVRSHTLFSEITAPGVSKGSALAFLAGRYGISREETIAAGDNGNDVTMIEWAGLGVAMANATPEALAAADWVAPSVAEDGVADLIDRFILSTASPHGRTRPQEETPRGHSERVAGSTLAAANDQRRISCSDVGNGDEPG